MGVIVSLLKSFVFGIIAILVLLALSAITIYLVLFVSTLLGLDELARKAEKIKNDYFDRLRRAINKIMSKN